jgi:beta-N-acetylhexosaminidase
MQGCAGLVGGVPSAAVVALAAGNDLLCLGSRIDEELVAATVAEVAGAVRDGRLSAARLEDAAARVDALATWTLEEVAAAPPDAPVGLGYQAARRAIRVDGSLAVLAGSSPLVVHLDSEPSIAAGRVPWGLGPHLAAEVPQLQVPIAAGAAGAAAVRAQAADRPVVLVGRPLHAAAALVEDLAATHPVVAVEMGWPSAWRPAGVRAFVTTYGASRANGQAAAAELGLSP